MPPAAVFFIGLLLLVSRAAGQEGLASSSSAEPPGKEAVEAPLQVDVQPLAGDQEISQRLTDILVATEWFVEPAVVVQDGVVFLRGVALEEKYRVWATELARRTSAVAAVVNRMEVQPRSIWDMGPALTELRMLSANAVQMSPLILFGFAILAFTWLLARGARRLAGWLFRSRIENVLLRSVAAHACMLPVFLLGLYIVLRVAGLTQLALTVLGGTGIAGLIIGIAFRDIAENFLASILISAQNPFHAGDLIRIGEHEGLVQRVTTRGTILMTFDGNHVLVPNATVYKSIMTNYSTNPQRRLEFVVGIGYDDSATKAQEIVKRALDEHPHLVKDPESRVILDQLGPSTVNLKVYLWIDASRYAPDAVRSSVMRMVKQALKQGGISLPDEAREVIFPNQVPVRILGDDAQQPSPSATGQATTSPRDGTSPAGPILDQEEIHSPAEGKLQSNTDEIQRQADQSRLAEEGPNLLASEPAGRRNSGASE